MRLAASVLGLAMVAAAAMPASAQEVGEFDEVWLVPADGVSVSINGRSYSGSIRIRAMPDGLSLVERVGIDGYLAGIREVPATWPAAALEAQAVAARTYLAWTLDRGRSTAASKYDFDICATTQCQVYAGTGAGEPSWVQAVGRTAGEILVFDGSPAQAMYFSTSGGRTEAIQDIFAGSTPKPYLAGAPSPDESSPLVEWRVSMPLRAFVDILGAGGYRAGEVVSVEVIRSAPGAGVWHMEVLTSRGTLRVPVSAVRRIFNDKGPELFPDELPALRPDGRRYPQAILSYRFDVSYLAAPSLDRQSTSAFPVDDRPFLGTVVFEGVGWGHHVGMSQYGALAMAEKGADYADILGHYYGGLQPTVDSAAVPNEVLVGLDWGEESYVARVGGSFRIVADGRTVEVAAGGTWIFDTARTGSVSVLSGDLLLDRLLKRFGGLLPVT